MHICRCIRDDEIFNILSACHDEPCSGYFADHRTRHKVLQMGYYWPTIFKDAKKYVKACNSCQRMGRFDQSNEMPLQPQLVIEPFEIWALYFVSPFNPPFKHKSYIVVAIDYVKEWVETVEFIRAIEETFINFHFEIFVRNGLPIEVITEKGYNS